MEDKPVQAIRETRRNQLFFDRKKLKHEETDCRRSLSNLRISQKSTVISIANKLKTKSSISASELQMLQNAIADDVNNIDLVLNTHGALRGLVRELSGHDVSKQCAAVGCLCNLALADSKACAVIARAAGAYLIAALDTFTTQLAVSSAWTVGNLCGGGARPAQLVLDLGGSKLCDVMHGDVTHAPLYALTHLAFALNDDLKPEHLQKIIISLTKIDITVTSSRLLFILSCHKDFAPENIPETFLQKMVEQLTVSMINHLHICNGQESNSSELAESKCCELIYLARVLANMNSEMVYRNIISYFIENNLIEVSRGLLKSDSEGSLWWFYGNMLNTCGENEFFEQLLKGF